MKTIDGPKELLKPRVPIRKSLRPKSRRRTLAEKYTLTDIICDSVDELDKRGRMLIYKHPTNLSPEQVLFVLELLGNGYDISAAIESVYGTAVVGMTPAAIKSLGQKLMQLKKVRDFIEEQTQLRADKLQLTADWVAKKYKTWADIDVLDYISIEYSSTGRSMIKLKAELEDLPKDVRGAIKKIKSDPGGGVVIEFIDQKQALDSLSKLLGLVENKLTVETKGPVILSFDQQDSEA